MLPDSDRTRIRHIVDAAREAVDFVKGTSFDDALRNRQLQLSLVRCVEIIGEAATRASLETRNTHPEIPRQDMIGMRNRIVHAYFDVDLAVVWEAAANHLPALALAAERALETLFPDTHRRLQVRRQEGLS